MDDHNAPSRPVRRLHNNRKSFTHWLAVLTAMLVMAGLADGVARAQQVTTLFTTKEDFTGWTDNSDGKSMVMEPTDATLDQSTENGLGNVQSPGVKGTGGALAVTWKSGDFNGIKSPGQEQNTALIQALGTGAGRKIMVDYTEPQKGTGTYFSLLLNLNYNNHWTQIKPTSVSDHGTYKTATYEYTFNPEGLTYLSIGFIYASNYNTNTPFTIDNVRLVTAGPATAGKPSAPAGKKETTSVFTTKDDFAGWTDNYDNTTLVMEPTDASLDKAAVNGLGNVANPGKAGASGALAVTWKKGDFNGFKSPGQQQNTALIDALGTGANKQILVDYTEPPTGSGSFFSLLLNLNYDGHWTQIKPASVSGHGTYKTAAFDYSFTSAGLTYLSIGFIYSSNYNSSAPFTIDNVRIVTTIPDANAPSVAPTPPVKEDMPAPAGVTDAWGMKDAWTQNTPTRSEVSLNGLWRFYPVYSPSELGLPHPDRGWGWFKVPGAWPPANAAQHVLMLPAMNDYLDQLGWKLSDMEAAWYKRTISVPQAQTGRRFLIDFGLVQTRATVYVDGKAAGEMRWPGGKLDITSAIKPGQTQELAILVTAYKAKAAGTAWFGLGNSVKRDNTIRYRGLTGDITLISEPMNDALGNTHIITSVRQHKITFDTAVSSAPAGPFRLSATIHRDNKPVLTITSEVLGTKDIVNGRVKFSGAWANPLLWDLDTPRNMYTAVIKLEGADGKKLLDESTPISFGFREFWIDGRDFYLNGSKVHLRMAVNDTLTQSASGQSLEGALLTCDRAAEDGFNTFITTPYGFLPGEVGYADNLYRATDQKGMLVSVSLLNIMSYDWKLDDPEVQKEYNRVSDYLIHSVWNHPSVFAYAMNHNGLVYYDAANPRRLDGIYTPDGNPKQSAWQAKARGLAMSVAAAHAKEVDPTRPVYHHAAGNLGDMITLNLYPNWAPIQERSDWFTYWAEHGVKPLMIVEYGLPHVANWSSYRGPDFIWTSQARMWLLDREYAAAFTANDAYTLNETELQSQELQLKVLKEREKFFFWDINSHLVQQEHNFLQIKSLFYGINLPIFRTWGLSGLLPWDNEENWIHTRTVEPTPWPNPYANLKRPGIVPDVRIPGKVYLHAWDKNTFKPSSVVKVLQRSNQPLLGFIAGAPDAFTARGHNYRAGEAFLKQLAIINDARKPVTCRWSWTLEVTTLSASGEVVVQPGEKAMVPASLQLPDTLPAGAHALKATFDFGNGQVQHDEFQIDVLGKQPSAQPQPRIALFDPSGDTDKYLQSLGLSTRRFASAGDLPSIAELQSNYDLVVIGRNALDSAPALPQLQAISSGLKVLIFEQDVKTLNRLGFRTQTPVLRQVFIRDAKHPVVHEVTDAVLHDWRGDSTLVAPYRDRPDLPMDQPHIMWLGFKNDHVWRAGNRGSVTSVVIEKPPVGNFTPLLDCGFDLQYTPLLEYTPTQGNGRVIFCQLDVTGRSENDPAADNLTINIIQYLAQAHPQPAKTVLYDGDDKGAKLLAALGVKHAIFQGQPLDANSVLIVGPGSKHLAIVADQIQEGATLLGLGLTQQQLNALVPGLATLKEQQTLPAPLGAQDDPTLRGISNAEVFWRDFPTLNAITSDSGVGNASLRIWHLGKGTVVLSQALPRMFDDEHRPSLRTSYRRTVYLVSRLLHNLGAMADCPLVLRLAKPDAANATPWLHSYYLQTPVAEDDPYRFFPW